MAECRSCGKEIPEGTLYCNECEARMKADGSYLNSLLSSVVANSVESAPKRPVKKTTAEPMPSAFSATEEAEKLTDNFVIEDLEELYSEPEVAPEVYDELIEEAASEPYAEIPEEIETESYNERKETVEDIFTPVTENVAYDEPEIDFDDDGMQEEQYSIFQDTDDSFLDDLFENDDVTEDTVPEAEAVSSEDELLDDLLRSVDGIEEYEFDLDEIQADAAAYDDEVQADAAPASVFDSYDEALDAEAALLGEALAEEVFATEDVLPDVPPTEESAAEFDDDPFAVFGLAGEPSGVEENVASDESGDDIMDIWGLMNSDADSSSEDGGTADAFGDFPELFGSEDEYMNIPEVTEEQSDETSEEKPKPKKKKNIFKRIFGNIREDLTEEEIEERKRLALEKFEEDEQKAADEAARAKLNKEEKAKRKEEEAAQKQEEKEMLARKKAEEKRAKAEEKRIQKDKKEQAKRALLAEIEENEGKINKFGASIIIVMFAAVLCLITIGTSYYNYKISIDKAQFDFDLQRYDDAYNDVYGLEIKEEDMELYDKIMTVQYVNVQLLSYMRYHSLDMDAEALDSLMKGLRRYEKFIQHGTELGVKKDLNYLKTQIVEQLDEVFGIDEATAYAMLALETQEEYSAQIYEIISKKN